MARPSEADWRWTGLHVRGDLVNRLGDVVDVSASLYQGVPWTATPTGAAILASARILAVADVNGDGLEDVALAPSANNQPLAVLLLQVSPLVFVNVPVAITGLPASSATSGSDVKGLEWADGTCVTLLRG